MMVTYQTLGYSLHLALLLRLFVVATSRGNTIPVFPRNEYFAYLSFFRPSP